MRGKIVVADVFVLQNTWQKMFFIRNNVRAPKIILIAEAFKEVLSLWKSKETTFKFISKKPVNTAVLHKSMTDQVLDPF